MPGLAVGDTAPDFNAIDHRDRPVHLTAFRGRCVVLFFYPKDNTPACTAQACAFRDAYEDFAVAGAIVIGISADSDSSHRAVAEKRRLPYYLVSDEHGALRKLFGVPRSVLGLFPGRVTYVIGPDGVVRHIFNSQLRVGGHVDQALATVKALGSGTTRSAH